jgi:hypothetical protein
VADYSGFLRSKSVPMQKRNPLNLPRIAEWPTNPLAAQDLAVSDHLFVQAMELATGHQLFTLRQIRRQADDKIDFKCEGK